MCTTLEFSQEGSLAKQDLRTPLGYTSRVVSNGLKAQINNPELKVRGLDPLINNLIDKLQHFNQNYISLEKSCFESCWKSEPPISEKQRKKRKREKEKKRRGEKREKRERRERREEKRREEKRREEKREKREREERERRERREEREEKREERES
ncbi:hypothetical protein DUI87_21513 [Hirundo rustica rustica]|uniref:Uncharacterized protein n=1 Tax=Hirundo rustica rustica TaxID=333673 RepID=A0A3M0JTA0_HIRRU|nr:hypothetical protein DUI87_21513 [Hirundo rustica rustica]